jgi:hypothetical protein
MQIHDDIFEWEGWGGLLRLASGRCRLRIFDLRKGTGVAHLKPIVVVIQDVAGSPMSIRSCTSHIATRVTQEFGIEPSRMLFVEYNPEVVYGATNQKVVPERFDRVDFDWHAGRAVQPRWRPLESALRDLLKGLLAAGPTPP